MKKLIIVSISLLITACANYGWIPPQGRPTRDVAFETQYCQDSAFRKYPKLIVTKMVEPERTIFAHQECRENVRNEASNCKRINDKLVCDVQPIIIRDCHIEPTRIIAPRYVQVDENEDERKKDISLCMQSRGYVWGEIK